MDITGYECDMAVTDVPSREGGESARAGNNTESGSSSSERVMDSP